MATIDANEQAKKISLTKGDTQLIIKTASTAGVLRNQLAYMLATTYHETAFTMKPVREYGGETYLKSKKYYPYVGMGYVQLTWKFNYEKASQKLGVNFVAEPKLLLEPKYAAQVLIRGMLEGWFVPAHPLTRYVTIDKSDFYNARRGVNSLDKAAEIAVYAKRYDELLMQAGYGVEAPKDHVVDGGPIATSDVEPKVRKRTWLETLVDFVLSIFVREP